MILTWLLGFNSLVAGCATVRYLREGVGASIDEPQTVFAVYAAARLAAIAEAHSVTFPVGLAHVALGGLLLSASAMAIAGRPLGRSLALQAIAVMAVLAVVEYALTHRVRAAAIDAVLRADDLRAATPSAQQVLFDRRSWVWADRVRFALFDLGTLTLAALALTRRRTLAYFDSVARPSSRAEEP